VYCRVALPNQCL